MADFRVITPLDREGARQRLAHKRARRVAERVSAGLRTAAANAIEPPLTRLLMAIAADMDDYLGTRAQATGSDADHPVWQTALKLARAISGTELHDGEA